MVYFGYSHVRNILIEKCGKKTMNVGKSSLFVGVYKKNSN